MPIIIAAVVLVGFFIWWAWGRDQAKSKTAAKMDALARKFSRKCSWTPVKGKTASLQEYRCQSCGVTAYSNTGKPPTECKKALRGSL